MKKKIFMKKYCCVEVFLIFAIFTYGFVDENYNYPPYISIKVKVQSFHDWMPNLSFLIFKLIPSLKKSLNTKPLHLQGDPMYGLAVTEILHSIMNLTSVSSNPALADIGICPVCSY